MAAAAIRLPSIDGLRAVEATARLGSFERAADELNVTASAVGKRVATVEELLGAALFKRGAKALTLTATGKEYLAQVSAALGLLAAMPLHQRAVQRTQRLRVTTHPPSRARSLYRCSNSSRSRTPRSNSKCCCPFPTSTQPVRMRTWKCAMATPRSMAALC